MERGKWKGQEEKGTGGVERGEEREEKRVRKERKGRGGINRDVRGIEREGGEK